MITNNSLVVIETHPIQYHAPVYRMLEQKFGIPVTVIYGSDFSVVGYRDSEFGVSYAWHTDLLSGYKSLFLSRSGNDGAQAVEEVSARGMGKILHALAPSAVLLVGYSPWFYQMAIWYAWRSKHPLLFRGETGDHTINSGLIKRGIRDRFLRWFYNQCAFLLYIGKYSYEHYRRLGCYEQKLVFAPYCVDSSVFQAEEHYREQLRKVVRQELDLSSDHLIFMFSGKLVPRKAPHLLLQAVRLLPPGILERAAVLYMGDGHLKESLKHLAQSQPSCTVRFVGFQNQLSLSRYYHAADIMVLPSYKETWGLVVNEALHHGLPCVVSRHVGCTPDLIEPGITGEVFETGSPHDLSLALQRATKLVGRPEIRFLCRKKVSEYTVDKAAQGIAQAYCRVNYPATFPRL